MALRLFYKRGDLLTTYDRTSTKRRSKKLKQSYYEQSDSRAPDTNDALFPEQSTKSTNRKSKKRKNIGEESFPVEPLLELIAEVEGD